MASCFSISQGRPNLYENQQRVVLLLDEGDDPTLPQRMLINYHRLESFEETFS